ncbi:hypothetical protein V2J09_002950 [Rumex salicifolius]
MAESTTYHGSPITRIAQDHLFSILLLLPINSILSFATTCRRFNSLASSDALWEAVCRRDWGSSRVDAIKSSYTAAAKSKRLQRIPWMKMYKQVSQLGNVSCSKLICSVGDDELVPNPRASHSLNFVADCLVLFGGGCDGGRHLDDTWVAYTDETKKVLKWHKVHSGTPSGRFGHTCVVVGDSLVLFGGINDHGIRQNDTWVGRTAQCGTRGMTITWRLLDVGVVAPPPRGAHAGCCIGNSRMLVYGGIGPNGVRLGDTWVLHLSEDLQLGTWHEIVTYPSPPARSGHSLTFVDDAKTVLFGGRGLGYEVLHDVWLFDTLAGQLRWVQVLFNLRNVPNGISLPRVGHSATLTLGGQILVYGGEDSQRHRKNDIWLLDVNSVPAIQMHYPPFSTNSEASLTRMWKRLKTDGYKPNARSFHTACSDHSGLFLYVFGGMVDGDLHPAEPNGLSFDGDFFLEELQLI